MIAFTRRKDANMASSGIIYWGKKTLFIGVCNDASQKGIVTL